jgi:hypothetical protein
MTPTPPSRRRRRRRTGSRRPAPEAAAAAATTPVEEPAAPEPAGILEPVVGEPPLAHPPLAEPERAFAARVPPPEPDRPWPATRRAIFFDVENSSRPEHIARVLDYLKIERGGQRTEAVAVGNWRVIGGDTARLLARHGVQLVHSAPATGVRDWSDLRIAVAAGVWLGGARPGDLIEIVSDDRAFDAVGDVAAMLGVNYRRLSYRALAGLGPAEAEEEVPAEAADTASRRRRRDGRRRHPAAAAEHRAPARPHAAPAPARHAAVEGHTAPHDEIVELVRELAGRSPDGRVLIDTLANALKARGFRRTPGSPRLITRLRRIKELSVSPSGMISLVEGAGRPPQPAPAVELAPAAAEPAAEPGAPAALAPEPAAVPAPGPAPERPAVESAPEEAPPGPDRAPAGGVSEAAGPEPAPGPETAPPERRRRRRGRRGGRGRRRRSQPEPAPSS